jgi:hypothetical protein
MKLKDFIEHLRTLPNQNCEVEVIHHERKPNRYYEGGDIGEVPFDPSVHLDYNDLTETLLIGYRE